ERSEFARYLYARKSRAADHCAVATLQIEKVASDPFGVREAVERRALGFDAGEVVVGGVGSETHRADVVVEFVTVASIEVSDTTLGIDVGHAPDSDGRAVENGFEVHSYFVGEFGSTDHPVEFVLDEVVGPVVDYDEVD